MSKPYLTRTKLTRQRVRTSGYGLQPTPAVADGLYRCWWSHVVRAASGQYPSHVASGVESNDATASNRESVARPSVFCAG